VLLASPASARCIGSTDPLIQRMELEIGRNPAAAVDSITKTIAVTQPADTRRLAELYLAKSHALYMSGAPSAPYEKAMQKAQEIGGAFGPSDNIGMYLRIGEAVGTMKGPEKLQALKSVARDYEALPDGSRARTCRGIDLAFYYDMIEQTRDAMAFATRAYRNSGTDRTSIERAKAASVLAFLVSEGHDFEYANKLHSEAFAIMQELKLTDLASNEVLLRGYTHLARGDWKSGLADFEESARLARSYGNQYAVDYALIGVCEAALEGKMIARAAPACEHVYDAMAVPGERMAFPATMLMASLQLEQGRPARALQLLDPLMADGRGETASGVWIGALKTRAQALSVLGRNREAYAAMREAQAEAKDHYDRELQSGVAALRARFQTEELQSRLSAEERASNARLRLAIAVIVGSITTLVLLGTLIFFLLRHRRRFRHLAMTDPLTGLANRRATLERADEALRILGTERPRASVALFDIDHFKSCNDTYGHDAGDRILSEFARIMEDSVRPTDIVGRWGGEEFLAIFPAASAQEAEQIIDHMRQRAASEAFDFAPDYRLKFSAGVAVLEEADDRMGDCIKLADKRLYAAKAAGRNRTCASGQTEDIRALSERLQKEVAKARAASAEAA